EYLSHGCCFYALIDLVENSTYSTPHLWTRREGVLVFSISLSHGLRAGAHRTVSQKHHELTHEFDFVHPSDLVDVKDTPSAPPIELLIGQVVGKTFKKSKKVRVS